MKSSIFKSRVERGHESEHDLSLDDMDAVTITETMRDGLKKHYPILRHVDAKNGFCEGWFDGNGELAAYVCSRTDKDGRKWIQALEVMPDFRGHGLGKQLLQYAVEVLGCEWLSVNKDNEVAYKIYSEYGFATDWETDTMFIMRR